MIKYKKKFFNQILSRMRKSKEESLYCVALLLKVRFADIQVKQLRKYFLSGEISEERVLITCEFQ